MSDDVRPGWTKSQWAVPVLGALLFFNLLLFVANQRDLLAILSALPQPVATLIAGIVGLGAIAWQTRRGFQNLIASQEHRANLDREARLHQAEIADAQASKQVERDRKILAASIHAELIGILPQVHNTYQSMRIQKYMFDQIYSENKNQKVDFRFPNFKTDVFESSISKIGLLGPSIAGDVIAVYSLLRMTVDPPIMKDTSISIVKPIAEGLAATYSKLGGEIVHVGSRLSHVQFGSPDPGTLYDFRQKRDAEDAKAG